MKLLGLILACLVLLAAPAVAGSHTTFMVPTGYVDVDIRLMVPDDEVDPHGFAPGQKFNVVLTAHNQSLEPVMVLMPFFGMRCPMNGVGHVEPLQHRSEFTLAAGQTVNHVSHMVVPLEADIDSLLKVGATVAVDFNLEDMRNIFTSVRIVRGLTTAPGFKLGVKNDTGGSFVETPRRRRG